MVDINKQLKIMHGDITLLDTDVIVNSANPNLVMGRGVCGAIFRKAGIFKLRSACRKIERPITYGQAVITPAFNLNAKYIIHTTAKPYIDGKHDEEHFLNLCYENCLHLAVEKGCKSIAFPVIGGGIYGFNHNNAVNLALLAIGDCLFENKYSINVILVLYPSNKKNSKKPLTSII
jgi:O-acetyl-ADP-ribose deacetylase (regulator of RNase III)